MAENNTSDERPISREERLAAKLRENLRRRKHQAKAMSAGDTGDPATKPPIPALPKTDAPG